MRQPYAVARARCARDLSRTTGDYVERVTSVTNGIIMPSKGALLGRCVPRDAGTN